MVVTGRRGWGKGDFLRNGCGWGRAERKARMWKEGGLKVHKIEKFFGSDFEFCVISA
jgi:hypothetical protein